MTKEEVRSLLNAEVIVSKGPEIGDKLDSVCACDMMSELFTMISRPENQFQSIILLTHLVNSQVIRIAEMTDIRLVVFVCGKRPLPDTKELAVELGVTILSTPFSMFKSCGMLYKKELKDIGAIHNKL